MVQVKNYAPHVKNYDAMIHSIKITIVYYAGFIFTVLTQLLTMGTYGSTMMRRISYMSRNIFPALTLPKIRTL